MSVQLDPRRLERFANAIEKESRIRVRLPDLWRMFAQAFPNRPATSEERDWLSEALDQLVDQGRIEMPSPNVATSWDHSAEPLLPAFVVRVVEEESDERDWASYPWHPRLAWVRELKTLTSEQETFLRAVHEGLVADRFSDPAPLKYRSLQLTRNEKRLAQLARGHLFDEGRLTLEMLGAVAEVVPFAYMRIGPTPRALVFENAGPFHVCGRLLQEMGPAAPYGLLVYGGGAAFLSSVRYFGTLEPAIERADYVGDLDRKGIRIAYDAARTAREEPGLPDVRAAPGFHAAMMAALDELGRTDGWEETRSTKLHDEALAFIPAAVRPDVRSMLEAGRRIPEEILSPQVLRRLIAAQG